jgi:hypothetical protein
VYVQSDEAFIKFEGSIRYRSFGNRPSGEQTVFFWQAHSTDHITLDAFTLQFKIFVLYMCLYSSAKWNMMASIRSGRVGMKFCPKALVEVGSPHNFRALTSSGCRVATFQPPLLHEHIDFRWNIQSVLLRYFELFSAWVCFM